MLQNIEHRMEGVSGRTILPEPTWVSYFSAVCRLVISYHSKDLLFRNVAFAASRKNKDVIDVNDDSDNNHYQLKTPPPVVFKTSGMSPSPQKKKQKSSGKAIAVDFLSRMVNQVSTHICGPLQPRKQP